MRNLRKLTAVVIAFALVLVSMSGAFAATTPVNADKAATLKDLGLYAGTDANDVAAGLEGALTTQDSLIFLAKLFGYNDAANKLTADEVTQALAKFADANTVSDYAKNVVAYSAINKILSGSTKNGKFFVGAKDTVTAARFATFMLKQMGYTVPSFTESVAQISEVKGSKVSATITGGLTRDVAVGMMYGALPAEKATAKTVIADIVGNDTAKKAIAEKAGLIAAAATLDVEKVTVSNLREMVITFNRAIDATEAVDEANYKIDDNAPQLATLSEDGRTVTLLTYNNKAMSNYDSDIKLVLESELGLAADKTITGIAAKDTTVPTVVSASTTGPRNIKVILSEPLNETEFHKGIANAIKVDSGFVAIDAANATLSGVELTLKTFSDLTEGSHKIEFASNANTNLIDNAGYKVQAATLNFEYVKDTSALSLSVVESNETSVTVKFNKAIEAGSFKGNTNVEITHTYSSSSTNKVTGAAVTTSDDQKFVITFGKDKPFPPGATTVYINYASSSGLKIKDNYGNALAATSFNITTSADNTKPTATAEFVDADTVKVTYSENVVTTGSNSALDPNNYVLKNGSEYVSVTPVLEDASNLKVVLLNTTANALNGTTYSLTIKNVKDISVAGNQMDEVTLTFTGTDKVAPTVNTDSSKLVAADKYKVVFSEAMDVASISDKSIYRLNGNALKTEDTVEVIDNNKAVIITFKNADTKASIKATGNTLDVGRVKDAVGNWTEGFVNSVTAFDSTPDKVSISGFEITGKNAIKLKFNDTIQNMVTTDFEYTTNSSVYVAPNSLSVSIVDGVTYITLATNDIPSATGAGVEVRTVGETAAQSIYGSKLAFDTKTAVDSKGVAIDIVDKRAPAKSAIVGTLIADGNTTSTKLTLNTVSITYDEDIYASSVQETDYTVAGYTVSDITVSGNVVTITVTKLDYGAYTGAQTDANIAVKQVGEIQDVAKNTLAAQDAWELDVLN